MKRLFITIGIMCLIIAIGTIEHITVQSVLHSLEHDIQVLHENIISHEGADISIYTQDISKLKQYWIEHEEKICIMFNHKDLLPITESITRASANIKNNNHDDTIIELNLLEEYTENSAHIMSFHINNIL